MRKILTPFVAALLLLLTLAPQAKATPNYLRISANSASYALSYDIGLVGDWSDADVAALNFYYRTKSYGGSSYGSWTQVTKRYSKTQNNSKYGVNSAYGSLKNASGFTKEVEIKCSPNATLLAQLGKTKHIQIDVQSTVSTTDLCSVSGNVMTLFYGDNADNYSDIPIDYAFYELFDTKRATGTGTSSGSWTADFSGLELPATGLTTGCYESMFSNMTTHMVKGPVIKAMALSDECGDDYTDCCKNMFSGCSNLASLTAYFLAWGKGTGSSSPTYNWITSTKALTFNCPNALTQTQGANYMGSNGTKTTIIPDAYVFNVATNSGTWNGTCNGNKYYTRAISNVATTVTPAGSSFEGWYTDGDVAAPTNLSAPSGMTTYYAHFSAATNHNVAIASYNSNHGTVTVAWNDGSAQTLTSGNTDILDATPLTITAIPNSGYKLTGLTITPSGGDPSDFTSGNGHTLSADITVTATFVAKSFTLAINGTDNGTITCDDGTYVQGAAAQSIAVGTTVTFTATPDDHYELTGWTGALSGTDLETSLTVDADMNETLTVGATFALEQFTISATSANNTMGSVTGGGTYSYGAAVTLTATANDGYRFVEWSDGNTSNPRNFTASENLNLTATFGLESVDQTVKVYQGATADTTKILYALTAKTVGGITYTPIDMGYGVAWADRNIGAANESAVGSLFYWGGTSATNTFRSGTYQTGIASVAAEADFSTDYDAAYQIIGHYWRVPSKSDWQALINEYGSVTTFTSKISNEGFSLPANGYIQSEVSSQSQLSSSEADYWSRTKGYKGSGSNDRAWVFKNGSMNSGVTGYASYGLPIRPIYQPTFTIYTLTINVGSYKYVYKCQSGQSITVNVHATELGASFDEWSEDHNTNATRTFTVTGNATYTATFAEATTYAITFVDEDGETVLDGPNDVIEGNIPVYGGETPTKAATAQYTYTFNGWSPALYAADKAQTYTATYSSTVNQYTVTWKSENGESTLETDADQNYGTATAFNGTTPTKAADAEYTYTFDGWATEANGDLAYANGSTPTVSGDATYFAHFNATEIVTAFDLEDNHGSGDSYYDDYAALVTAGNAIDITYKRSFTAGRWATFSLPFGYSFQNQSHNTFRDQVFELTSVDYADGRMVINCVKNSTGIVANTPYILIPTSDIDNPTFEGVTPKAIAAGSKTVNNTKDNVYTVEFISTAYKQVMPTGKRTIYISGNRLYYANVDTDIPAFRGYFNLKGGDDVLHIQPRLVIAAPDGETIEQAEEAVAETRKYMENGILVIERNGVKYDAQGHVIK